MINSNDLKSFLVTAKNLHLTKSAMELGLSQPALSHCIKRLELEVGSEFFLRRKEGLILTPAGVFLEKNGAKVLEQLSAISSYLTTGKYQEKKTLSLGLHPSVAAYTLPLIMKSLNNYQIKFHFGISREVTSLVQEGKIDCAIAINPYPHSNLIINTIGSDEFQLWWNPKKIQSETTLFYDPQLHQSHFLMRQLEKKGIKFEEQIEIPSLELIAKFIYEGCGVGILPSRVVKNYYPEKTEIYSKKIKPFLDKVCFVYALENKQNEQIKDFKIKLQGIL